MSITIGADPEVMLRNKKGQFIPPTGLIGGSKEEPLKYPCGGALQEDGAAAEYNIKPAKNAESFLNNYKSILSELHKVASENNLRVSCVDSAIFTDDHLETPELQVAGCDPDYNAYEYEQNNKPELGKTKLRFCGGHIHVGSPKLVNDPTLCTQLVRALDLSVGLFEVAITGKSPRRDFYGRAGDFRMKEYGIEYRTPSNFWTKNEVMVQKIWRNVQAAYNHSRHMNDYASSRNVRDIIDSGDREAAKKLYVRVRDMYEISPLPSASEFKKEFKV